jgi:hypothetical protein
MSVQLVSTLFGRIRVAAQAFQQAALLQINRSASPRGAWTASA